MYLKKTLGVVAIVAVAIVIVFVVCVKYWGVWHDDWSGYTASTMISDGVCNIAVVPIYGEVLPYDSGEGGTILDEILPYVERIEAEEEIDGVLLAVDSPGGFVSSGWQIAEAFRALDMPVAAHINETGSSAAYLIASGADMIMAAPTADVGSIGFTASYLSEVGYNKKEGYEYVELTSAPFKDVGSAVRSLSVSEKARLQADLAAHHEKFVEIVAGYRDVPVEKIAELADGGTWPAPQAKELGLVDFIGSRTDTRAWFAEVLQQAPEEVQFCW